MLHHSLHNEGVDLYDPLPSFRFGVADDPTRLGACSASAYLLGLPADHYGAVRFIDVLALQSEQLAGTERAETGEQDKGSEIRSNRVGEMEDDVGRDHRPLVLRLDPCPFEPAGIAADAVVVDCAVHDGSKQPVALGRLAPPGCPRRVGVPGLYLLRSDAAELYRAEGRVEMTLEKPYVPLPCHGRERSTFDEPSFDPPFGIGLESDVPGARIDSDPSQLLCLDRALEPFCGVTSFEAPLEWFAVCPPADLVADRSGRKQESPKACHDRPPPSRDRELWGSGGPRVFRGPAEESGGCNGGGPSRRPGDQVVRLLDLRATGHSEPRPRDSGEGWSGAGPAHQVEGAFESQSAPRPS